MPAAEPTSAKAIAAAASFHLLATYAFKLLLLIRAPRDALDPARFNKLFPRSTFFPTVDGTKG
jgi:hypothetical protein